MTDVNDLTTFSLTQLIAAQTQGKTSATEIVQAFVARADKMQDLNSLTASNFETAIDLAKQIDAGRASGKKLGQLAGIPVVVKDGLCTKGIVTTAGSRILENFVPPYDSTVVAKLKSADAIVLAKSNMDEFAMGGSNENSFFGPVHNPWDVDRVPGGSSGGSAAAVAARICPVAIGSDTGGSIRQPASFCGITGLKPTYGRVSRFGLIAFASSLDQIGPMAYSAEDIAIMSNVISGHDHRDSTSSPQAVPDFAATLSDSLRGKRIGICTDHFGEGVAPEVSDAVMTAKKVFEDLGAEVIEVGLPNTKHAVAAYYLIAPCEASSNLARYDGVRYTSRSEADGLNEMYSRTRANCFGDEVKRRIMLGTFALSSGYYDEYYLKASKVRRLIKQDYDAAFEKVDAILGPTTPTTAFKIGELTDDPVAMYLADVFTVSANLAGIPSISVPCGFDNSGLPLPIGMQLQGRDSEEASLLNFAHQYQSQTDWHTRRPND